MVASSSLKGVDSAALKNGSKKPEDLKSDELRLYGMRFCPFTQRALLVLAKKKVDVEIININLRDKPDWYLKKCPSGKVPALEHGSKIILDSRLIMEYTDEIFPTTRILPSDPYQKYEQRYLAEQLGGIVSPVVKLIHSSPTGSRSTLLDPMAAELTKAESLLMFAFFAGDNPGFADYFAYPFYRLLSMYPYINGSVVKDDDYPNDKLYPKVAKWLTAMSELSEVAACVQPQENVLKFLEDSFGGNQNYDTGL